MATFTVTLDEDEMEHVHFAMHDYITKQQEFVDAAPQAEEGVVNHDKEHLEQATAILDKLVKTAGYDMALE